MKVKFEKTQGQWYAVLPEYIEAGGDYADCLMVDGAPFMLDRLSNNGTEITVMVMQDTYIEDSDAVLTKYAESNNWGSYTCEYKGDPKTHHVGLCPVNQFVWDGIHPDIIYIKILK